MTSIPINIVVLIVALIIAAVNVLKMAIAQRQGEVDVVAVVSMIGGLAIAGMSLFVGCGD